MSIVSFTNQQEIDVSIRLDVPCLEQWIHLVGFVVAEHVDAKIVQLLQLLDFTKRCWKRDPSDVDFSFIATVGIYSSTIVVVWTQVCENAPYNALVIIVLNIENSPCLLNLGW